MSATGPLICAQFAVAVEAAVLARWLLDVALLAIEREPRRGVRPAEVLALLFIVLSRRLDVAEATAPR